MALLTDSDSHKRQKQVRKEHRGEECFGNSISFVVFYFTAMPMGYMPRQRGRVVKAIAC